MGVFRSPCQREKIIPFGDIFRFVRQKAKKQNSKEEIHMNQFQKGDEVQVLIDITSGWHIKKGTIGLVIGNELSYVEVDFHYKETASRLYEDDSLSYWDIACGPIVHEKNLKLVREKS
ncbi:hypothetical protein DB29_0P0019 (plasmid) [Shouchella clausii]|nr:hypothetical protein DB29_0P0019 [Shouchella clausii]